MKSASQPILRVKNLTKKYGSGDNAVTALNDVSFDVKAGEFVTILGPSGSGKSTLLHLLGGVDRPSGGSVSICGQDIYSMRDSALTVFRRNHIGLIYQFYNLIPVLTARENMCLPLLLGHRTVDTAWLEELSCVLGLENRMDHLPGELSGGQQQRVSIGRALMTHPDIILADEPTGNLDQSNTREVLALLKSLNTDYNQTIIMITHDLAVAQKSSRVLTIRDGRLC